MLLEAWLFLGVIGILATGVSLFTDDDGVAIIAGTLGFITWGIWTFGTLNVEKAVETTVYEYSMAPVAVLGVILALIPGYIALTGPVELVSRYRDGNPEEI